MAWGVKVQSAGGASSATFGAAPTAGNLILYWCASQSNVTFAAPTGWTGGTEVHESGGAARGALLSWKIADGTETGAISPSSGTAGRSHLIEYSADTDGFAATPLDVQNNNLTASSTVHTTPTVTPTSGVKRLIVCAAMVDATSQSWSLEDVNGSTTGVVEDFEAGGSADSVFWSLVVASTSGTYNGSATVSITETGAAAIAIFKPTSDGGGGATPSKSTGGLPLMGIQ